MYRLIVLPVVDRIFKKLAKKGNLIPVYDAKLAELKGGENESK